MATFITQEQRAKLIELYIGYFNRAPEAAGLNYWAGELLSALNAGQTEEQALKSIADRFYDAGVQYGIFSNGMTVEEFIRTVYQNVLGRDEVDAAGMTYWTQKLTSGEVSRGQFVRQVIQEAKDYVAAAPANDPYKWVGTYLENRKAVGEWFANNSAGLTGQDAIAKGTAIIANSVTKATAQAGQTAAEAIAAAQAAQQSQQGQPFTLTAGADNIVGTAGNDIINALTVNASGASATTLSAFDNIDGGAGTDTLNIYNDNTNNTVLPSSATVKNVETINIFNAGGIFNTGTAATVDASKFAGATAIWQHTLADDLTNLAATTTAGFKGVEATVSADVDVVAADDATTATIALDGVKGAATTAGAETQNRADIDVAGAALTGVTVTGTLAQKTTTVGAAAATLALNVTLAKNAQAGTVNSAVATILTIDNDPASTKDLTSVDASSSAGAITYTSADNKVATIKTGTGNDTVTIITATLKDDPATTSVDETISAVVDSGAGNDAITVNTTGTGTTTVNAGEGNDTVTLTGDGSGKLTVNLGAGNDTFKGTGSVAGTDVIDGGDGSDTLLLNMVGAANIGAFQNFEVFDAAALAKTLDVDILATKNAVTEFVASADVGASAVLTNVGAGVGYRVIGDTNVTNALTLTQKTAGALTITLDIDEPATTSANFDSGAKTNVDAGVVASNATSVKAVFDSSFKDAAVDASDNLTNLTIAGTKATSLEVVSGGAFAINDLVYVYGKATATSGPDGLLTSVTVSGDRAITLAFSDGTNDAESNIATVNASSLTGALTFNTADLKAESAANKFDGGSVTLGAGADVITIVQGAVINGLAKGSVEDAAAQGAFDVLVTGSAVAQAADVPSTGTLKIKDGLLTFEGTGPATLADAITAVDGQLTTDGDAVVFEYIGNSYVFVNNDNGSDIVVKLAGVTGLAGLDEVGTTNQLYVF